MITKKKRLIFEKQAVIAKSIAHPLRIAILDFLRQGPQCVCDIADHLDAEHSNVSRHLAVLVNSGVLEYEKQGLKVIYSLKAPCILDFFDCMTRCLKQQFKDQQQLLKAL